jgi:hypothetical protein
MPKRSRQEFWQKIISLSAFETMRQSKQLVIFRLLLY